MNTDLITQEVLTPALFEGDKLNTILADITKKATSFMPDLTTKNGRKEIASYAMRIAKSKTGIDGIGKDLVADAKKEIKLIDNKRKLARDTLDELKELVRRPLTEFEDAEKARVERLNQGVNDIRATGERIMIEWGDYNINELHDSIASLEYMDDGTWEEFSDAAFRAITESKKQIEQCIVKRIAYDLEQEELTRLRKEEEARQLKERDERVAKEAVERERIAVAKEAVAPPAPSTQAVNEMVTISLEEYNRLLWNTGLLSALMAADVESWSGYTLAMGKMNDKKS